MRDALKIVGLGILAILVVIGLSFGGIYVGGWIKRTTADWRGGTQQREQTVANADYRIASYDWYFDQCQSVVATERKIALQDDEIKHTKDANQKAVLRASVTALRNTREDLIAEYNANAMKEETFALFKSDDLPAQIDATNKETRCTA